MKSFLSMLTVFAFGVFVGAMYMQYKSEHAPRQPETASVESVVQPTNAPEVVVEETPAQPTEEAKDLEYLIPVRVGDTVAEVAEALGDPYLEFPKDGCLVQWYAGYEIVLTNGMVSGITERPVETEEERLERARYAEIAAQRINAGYRAMGDKAKKEYDEWLRRTSN